MKWLILLLFIVGCEKDDDKESIVNLTKWGRVLIDCPTAGVVVNKANYGNYNGYYLGHTVHITGCGLKVCCSQGGIYSCFPCKKDQWY